MKNKKNKKKYIAPKIIPLGKLESKGSIRVKDEKS